MSANDVVIDEQLYSRQLYVLGHEAMKKMQQSNVLIVGLSGVGVEIAKNVILSGVKSVTLFDDKVANWLDLSSQFYLSQADIGKNRLSSSIAQLRELNPYVPVKEHQGTLTEEFISSFNVVVFCDHNIASLVEMNDVCRKHNVKFIAVESRGLCGAMFCDFGNGFEVFDVDGESTVSNIVIGVSNENPGVVNVYDDKRTHGLYDGDLVVFEDVQGMDELNGLPAMEIKVTGKHAFTICDTTKFGKYVSGGYVKQVKKKKIVDFLPLKESSKNPTFIETDFAKLGRPADLHACFRALNEFTNKHGRLPTPYNKTDADILVALAKEQNENVNEDVARKFAFTCQGNLNPMAAFLGGIAAQEVQKACSGKFHPLHQWLYFDSFECLPENLPSEDDTRPLNTRYDGQIAVFGQEFQKKLLEAKAFIVGAGALGCEYLKNFAMVGVGCSNKGKVLVTDMDNIEISNLNRQFLFRKSHVGKMKSSVAASVAKDMNPDLNTVALNDKVAQQTEHVFDDDFWDSLDVVTNALDNVQARLYVDSRCVYYKKPLLEAGTLGTKGNIQVVIPNLTESYASSPDPPEQEIPICTLKNFPNAIEHTIQWARDLFEGLFKQGPEDVNSYLTKDDFLKQLDAQGGTKKSTLDTVYENLVTAKPNSFDDCIVWARLKFEHLFNHTVQQLLYNFPLDMITSSGTPFWGGPKRPPSALTFDITDKNHLGFIVAAANLRAEIYGLKGAGEHYNYAKVLSTIEVPKFVPLQGLKIASSDAEAKSQNEAASASSDEDELIRQLLSKLPKPASLAGYNLNALQFEKDDDTNFHIDFITFASNLRARNYRIKEADKHVTKGIAGKIIPAMVTTTASVTGLATFELYKVILGKTKLVDYKNGFINIALPFVTLSEPIAPAAQKMKDKSFTLWDRFEISLGRDITLQEFLAHFKKTHQLEINMMSCGAAVLYSMFGNKKKMAERMAMKMSDIVKEVTKAEFLPKQKYLNMEVCCQDEEGEDVDVPFIKYQFKF